MLDLASTLSSVDGVCDIEVHRPAQAPRGWLLIEVPHGATRKSDYDMLAARLKSALPAQLEHFFFVNTDIGAPEGAQFLGKTLSAQGFGVVVARCLIPRTFIDTNRVITKSAGGKLVDGMTPAVPGYINDPGDAAMLVVMHSVYHAVVNAAYASVCGKAKGLALQLHSFAPKSVNIEKTDAGIVEALHQAYVPEVYAKWPERPAVDLISATQDGSFKSAPHLATALRAAYLEAGIIAEENATYHLHPATMGLVYARAHEDQVLCVELNRGLVADPFVPFGVSPISAEKIERMTAPIGRVLADALGQRA
jgi:hypothetical protein